MSRRTSLRQNLLDWALAGQQGSPPKMPERALKKIKANIDYRRGKMVREFIVHGDADRLAWEKGRLARMVGQVEKSLELTGQKLPE